MAFTFDASVGGTASNSYITLSDANDYFDGRYENGLWSLSDADAQRLLVSATRRIDAERFSGLKAVETQALQLPRDIIANRDGYPYSSTIIPTNLENAVCELAYFILQSDDRKLSEVELHDIAFIESDELGPIKNKYRNGSNMDKLPNTVINELKAIGPGVWLGAQKSFIMSR